MRKRMFELLCHLNIDIIYKYIEKSNFLKFLYQDISFSTCYYFSSRKKKEKKISNKFVVRVQEALILI